MIDEDLIDEMAAAADEESAKAIEKTEGALNYPEMVKKAEAAVALQKEIDDLEEQAKEKKAELKKINEIELPKFFDALQIPFFGIMVGNQAFTVKDELKLVGSLNRAPDIKAAVAMLEATDFKGGVRRKVTMDFSVDEAEDADALSERLKKDFERDPDDGYDIPAGTLKSFIKEQLEKDPTFDVESVGLTKLRTATLTKKG